MNIKKHRWVLYLISITILTTVIVQFYWNFKNYGLNKQRIENEIQLSLDNAIEEYFADLSKKNYLAIVDTNAKKDTVSKSKKNDLLNQILVTSSDKEKTAKSAIQSIEIITDDKNEFEDFDVILDSITETIKHQLDTSLVKKIEDIHAITQLSRNGNSAINIQQNNIKEVKVYKGKRATDSLKLIKGLQTIFVAIQNNTINHQKVDSIFQKQLSQKNIHLNYAFQLFNNDTLYSSYKSLSTNKTKVISSKSTFLETDKTFKIRYANPSFEALKRSSTGILLSFILSIAVIASLFFLMKIINQQKQLAEIKNDLISNITHEFKTPITTVSAALEAITNFNALNNKEKTKKYISISEHQIQKLNLMVEKLLETATLDSEKLLLQKEEINSIPFLKQIVQRHQLITSNKTISFSSNINALLMQIDIFHFENAISNLIDNAIKYGGDKIEVYIHKLLNEIEIGVSDNGGNVEKNQQDKIFDKFYRVPKGNTHNVKGFGIGLYYTKKIIEKHSGNISVTSNNTITKFKILLPNE